MKYAFRIINSVICICIWLYICTISSVHVFAAGEFTADYDVQYAIADNGITIVTQQIRLTNNLSNLYPHQYSITIDSDEISNIVAYDENGILTPIIISNDGKTSITLTFNKKNIGLGKQMNFFIRFEDTSVARKNGLIWEITIPGISNDPDIQTYTVSLSVPSSFGPNAYTSPLPAIGAKWTKDQMIKGGISAAYGHKQAFDVRLTYYLENTTLSKQTKEIPIPPDTAYQQVIVHSLTPKPNTMKTDSDGNWIAIYTLLPWQRTEITGHLSIVTSMNVSMQTINPSDIAEYYTTPDTYWESDSPEIISLAHELKTPKNIFMYIINTLQYDEKRIGPSVIRKGALNALHDPEHSLCMEFTDLFISLARAAGIPAREIVGYAYTTNTILRPLSLISDVLHSWPEYYDSQKGQWIAVDPTWTKTTSGVNYFDKLDFNHLTFVIHGKSSQYPYPPGFYTTNKKTSKNISVNFLTTLRPMPVPTFDIIYHIPSNTAINQHITGNVEIVNTSGVNVPDVDITVSIQPIDRILNNSIKTMLPYQRIYIPVTIEKHELLTTNSIDIDTSINTFHKQFHIYRNSFISYVLSDIGYIGLFACISVIGCLFYIWKHTRT